MKRLHKILFQVTALLAVAALAGGCASGGASAGEGDTDYDGPTFELQINNDAFQDARVQVFWDQAQQNLGRIRGSSSQTFELPYHGNRVRLRIEMVEGNERTDTRFFTVNPDQLLTYRIDG